MKYYCYICKKDISKSEFLYSIEKFDIPLCSIHQQELNRKIKENFQRAQDTTIVSKEEITKEGIGNFFKIEEKNKRDNSTEKKKPFVKKLGSEVIKGVRKIIDHSKKRNQIRKWKNLILRRMTKKQLKKFCFERNIKTKKIILKEDNRSDEIILEKVECSKKELIARLRRKVSLNIIISFAKRYHINIYDILKDIKNKEAEWELKEISEKLKKNNDDFLLKLEKTIRRFAPMRQYNTEMYYQDSLASYLKAKYPNTKIEVSRGSVRPDIVINGVAIEVKGPTYFKDLKTIADKCLRYPQYFPKGMICVLFNVNVSQQLFLDWLKGMQKNHPNVKIIKL